MTDKSQRTEKPTPRRLDKARKEGQFPVSRDFVAGIQFLTFVAVAGWWAGDWFLSAQRLFQYVLTTSLSRPVTVTELQSILLLATQRLILPLFGAAATVMAASLGSHFLLTRFAFASKRLAPDISKLDPLRRLRELPKQNLPQFLQAVVLLPMLLYATWLVIQRNLNISMRLPYMSVRAGVDEMGRAVSDLLWTAAYLLLAWGLIDLVRQKRRFLADMRMSKQEIRDEAKESEGNPQVKGRMRRLQRDLLRRKMMAQVPTATAVVVNPTHYAVAIRYDIDAMAAPVVVAKGKNYLALRIRDKAKEYNVPIVENPPLAQALYKSVDVGSEIPAALYRAVAEVLAYIFSVRNFRRTR
jgi:flagellar biosynthetic protein FlhB